MKNKNKFKKMPKGMPPVLENQGQLWKILRLTSKLTHRNECNE